MNAPRTEPFWEAGYRDADADTFGPASEEVVRLAAELRAGARALDLGCGDGRNALALASRGLAVDAVDRSWAGIERLRARARSAGLTVCAWVQDLATLELRDRYDLVVAHGVLHLLEPALRRRLLAELKAHTAPGGRHTGVVFTDRLPPPAELAPHMRGLFREGELREGYADWEVERWAAYTLEDEHPGGIRHRHPINEIVARKPSAGD